MKKSLRPGEWRSASSLVIMGILIAYPLGALLLQIVFPHAFGVHMNWRPSLRTVQSVFTNPVNLQAVADSFGIGAAAAVFSTLVGLATAIGSTVAPRTVARAIDAGVWAVFFTPSYVVASGWLLLLQPDGLMQQLVGASPAAFNWFFSPFGLLLVMGLRYFPFTHFAVKQAVANMSPALMEAARLLGARRREIIRRIWLPLLAPALLTGASISFADGFGDFGLAAAIAPQMQIPLVSYQIYSSLYETPVDFASAAGLALIVVAVTGGALWLQFWWLGRRAYWTVSDARRTTSAARPRAALLTASVGGIVGLAVILPTGATVVQSLFNSQSAGLSPANLGLGAYASLAAGGQNDLSALLRSIQYALAAAVATALLSLFVAQQMTFYKSFASRLLNTLTMATIAVPGVVLAAGFVFAWNARWLIPLHLVMYGTPLCLALAFIAGQLPYGIRLQLGALSQIPPNLLTAAQLLGARRHTILRAIVLPLIRETAITTFLLTLTGVIFELPAASLLYPAGQPPFSVVVQQKFNSFLWNQGSALTIVGMTCVFIIYLGGNALVRRLLQNSPGLRGPSVAESETVPQKAAAPSAPPSIPAQG